MPNTSSNVFHLNTRWEVRNVRGSTDFGGGRSGQYWTNSVNEAICYGEISTHQPVARTTCAQTLHVPDRPLQLVMCGVTVFGTTLLVPICSHCNNDRPLRFHIRMGSLLVEEQRG